MARPVDHARRQQLLDAAVDHVCDHGLSGLSLRSVAQALGVDASLLLHHFRSKQQLLSLVLNGVRDRLRAVGAVEPGEPLDASLTRVWEWASDPAHRRLYLVFFEVYALALRSPDDYRLFLDTVVADWLGPLTAAYSAAGLDRDPARDRATLTVAVVRGLLLDLLATGDRARVEAALVEAASLLVPAARQPAQ